MNKETITLTFGEAGENHVGMEMIGVKGGVGDGFNREDFVEIKQKIEKRGIEGVEVQIIDLKGLLGDDCFVVKKNGENSVLDL